MLRLLEKKLRGRLTHCDYQHAEGLVDTGDACALRIRVNVGNPRGSKIKPNGQNGHESLWGRETQGEAKCTTSGSISRGFVAESQPLRALPCSVRLSRRSRSCFASTLTVSETSGYSAKKGVVR